MAHFDRIKNMTKDQLLREIEEKNRDGEHADQVKFTLIVRCTESIEASFDELRKSINKNAESSNVLSKGICWLNGILAFATFIIAIVAILNSICK